MLSCLVLVIALILCYCFCVINLFGRIPRSLSETAYMFGGYRSYIFTAVCFSCGMGLLPVLFSLTPDHLTFLPFIFCLGLFFAGLTPAFRDIKLERRIHYVSAIISFSVFMLYVVLCMNLWWLLIYGIGMLILCWWKKECYIFFAEVLGIILLTTWCILKVW